MLPSRKLSRYTPIWIALKRDNKVSIVAPPILHKRIIKAVKKRRDKDIERKYLLAESGHNPGKIIAKSEGNILHFFIRFPLSTDDI